MQPQIQQPVQTRERFIEELFAVQKKDNFLLAKEGVDKMINGVMKGYEALKGSYGSAGGNAVIKADSYPFYEFTNDGKKILESLKLADTYEMMGLNGMKEVAAKSDKESGDGRKTASLLYGAILTEGQKCTDDPMDIKRSLEACIPIITKSIDKQATPITVNEVGRIAAVASENEALGAMFQDIYQKIGSDGIIELDNSGLPETFYEITEGVKLINCGYMYPYMTNTDKGRKCELKNPSILITKQKIGMMSQIDGIIKGLIRNGKNELVIFCDEIDLSVSQALAYLAIEGAPIDKGHIQFKTLVIKAPTLWKDWLFDDFAKITGATIINPAEGTTLKHLRSEHLGTCSRTVTSKTETVVLGTRDISAHIQNLLDLNTDEGKIRAARLKTKTAILKLGANSETELSHLIGKALDGRNSSFLAMEGGIVPGGGLSLVKAVNDLPDTVGGRILRKALLYPTQEICKNLGKKYTSTVKFDNIYDAATVVKNSVTNAISVAATQLTTTIAIS
jgi:chaperonin GroEL